MAASKAKQALSAERDSKALRLRIEGKTYQQIADELGYSGPTAVATQIRRRLEQRNKELKDNADLLVTEQIAKLEELMMECWTVLNGNHVTVSNGRVVYDDATGRPLPDLSAKLQAVDRLQRLLKQQADLLGLGKTTTEGTLRVTVVGVSEQEMP